MSLDVYTQSVGLTQKASVSLAGIKIFKSSKNYLFNRPGVAGATNTLGISNISDPNRG